MRKILSLLALFTMMFVGAGSAMAQAYLLGQKVADIANLDNSKSYAIHSANNEGYWCYNASVNQNYVGITGVVNDGNGKVSNTAANKAYHAAYDANDANGRWNIILEEGSYYVYNIGAAKYLTRSGRDYLFTDAKTPIDAIYKNTDGTFAIHAGGGYSAGSTNFACIVTNTAPQAVRNWTSTDHGSILEFIEIEEISAEQLALNKQLSDLVADAKLVYEKNEKIQLGPNLIARNDQFFSPHNDPIEGSTNDLLDNNANTFWHSTWHSGDQPAHSHYIQVTLDEPVDGAIFLTFVRRNAANDQVTLLDVETSMDGNDFEHAAYIDMPNSGQGKTELKMFTLDKEAQYLRFWADATTTNRGYWHIGDFQLNKYIAPSINEQNPTEAAALLKAIQTSEGIQNATADDIAYLQGAYDAYLEALVPAVVYNIHVTGAEEGKVIYDGKEYTDGQSFSTKTFNEEKVEYLDLDFCDEELTIDGTDINLVYSKWPTWTVSVEGADGKVTFDGKEYGNNETFVVATLAQNQLGATSVKGYSYELNLDTEKHTISLVYTELPPYGVNFVNGPHTYGADGKDTTSRVVTAIKLGDTEIAVDGKAAFYQDLTETVNFTIEANETDIKPAIIWNGAWMHGFLYIDTDSSDKQFTEEELVANTALSGNPNLATGFSTFDAPAIGDYRARFKVDWSSKDAGGASDIKTNGGTIIDVMLHVVAPSDKVYTVNVEGTEEGGVIYNEKTYNAGSTITTLKKLALNELQVAEVEKYTGVVALDGFDINVTYTHNDVDVTYAFTDPTGAAYEAKAVVPFKADAADYIPTISPYFDNAAVDGDAIVTDENVKFNVTGEWNLPFQFSTVANGKFADGTKWYTLQNNGNATTNTGNGHVAYTANDAKENTIGAARELKPANLYCFVALPGTPGHFTIYNMEAGAENPLREKINTGFPHHNQSLLTYNQEDSELAIAVRPNGEGLQFYIPAETEWNAVLGKHVGQKFSVWSAGNNYPLSDAGSRFFLKGIEDLVEAAVSQLTDYEPSNIVGSFITLPDNVVEAIYSYMEDPSEQSLEALAEANTHPGEAERLAFDPTKPYRLLDLINREVFVAPMADAEGNIVSAKNLQIGTNKDVLSTLFVFEAAENEGEYYIKHLNSGLYIGVPPHGSNVNCGEKAVFTVTQVVENPVKFLIKYGNEYLNTNTSLYRVDGWNTDGEGSRWSLEMIEEVSVSVSAAGLATFCAPVDVTFPDDVKVYGVYVEGTEAEVFRTSNTVPAGAGVIIEAEEGTYECAFAEEAAPIEFNTLVGTCVAKAKSEGDLVLGKRDDQFGFYSFNGTTLAANKAYCHVGSEAASNGLTLRFSDLTSIIAAVKENGGKAIFDLQGRRVVNAKGITIQNGKKVIK